MKNIWWKQDNKHIDSEFIPISEKALTQYESSYFVVEKDNTVFFMKKGTLSAKKEDGSLHCLSFLPAVSLDEFGDKTFQKDHNTNYSYMAGAMANGISSEDMVISLGREGFLGSFGTGGLSPLHVEEAIIKIQHELPEGPYTFNLLHNPYDFEYEDNLIELYLKYNIQSVEAAAFIAPSPALVYYKLSGLTKDKAGTIFSKNKIIAKLSREEVAEKFMSPPAEIIINGLLATDKITPEQAELGRLLPLADDITVEADSGGHTDNRPLVSLMPLIISLRDQVQKKYSYTKKIRIGAAGGISTPQAALAAFSMGADYIVSGSVNQSCIEAGTSSATRELLANAKMSDVMMAPSADMFEMGGKVQVLKKGTIFPLIAQKLFELYKNNDSIHDIPARETEKLEQKIFKKSIDTIWAETVDYFNESNPDIIQKAENNPKKKMALIFRWYLGKSSHWSISGARERMIDAQIWCGQSMGAFNGWVKGTSLEKPGNRKVAEVALVILKGTALLNRINNLKALNVQVDSCLDRASPDLFIKN